MTVGSFVSFTLYLGLQWTGASHAVLFLYTAPFFVALGLVVFVAIVGINAGAGLLAQLTGAVALKIFIAAGV